MNTDMTDALTDTPNPAGAFVAMTGYTTSRGEVADYLINGAVNYKNYNARRRAFLVAALERAGEVTIDQVMAGCPAADINLASRAIQKRFRGDTRAWVVSLLADVVQGYQGSIGRCDGSAADWAAPAVAGAKAAAEMFEAVAPGVKRHLETGELHVSGLLVRKTVVSGPTRVSNPRPATIVKNFIRSAAEADIDCPKWVQFRLGDDNWTRLAFAGQAIENTHAVATAA